MLAFLPDIARRRPARCRHRRSLLDTNIMCFLCQKHAASIDAQVLDRILSHGRGWVFTPAHLADLGTRNAVASAPSVNLHVAS